MTERTPVAASHQAAQDMSLAVWDLPLRLWHWALAVAVLVAWLTPNVFDTLHRISGYAIIGLLVFRLVWGFMGTRYSQFRGLRRKLRASPSFLRSVRHMRRGRYAGLNPAGAAMLVAMLVALAVSSATGVMQTTVRFFGVWWVEDGHALVSHLVIGLAVVHIVGTLVMSVLQRDNLPKAMIFGKKRRR